MIHQIRNIKLGNRSDVKQYVNMILERNLEEASKDITYEALIYSLNNTSMASTTASIIGKRLISLLDIESIISDKTFIRLGGVMLNAASQADLIDVKKQMTITKQFKVKEIWMVTSKSSELTEMALNQKTIGLTPNKGYYEWAHPTMHVDDHKIDIVKKARRVGLLHKYRKTAMPDVYKALNKMGKTDWIINDAFLEVVTNVDMCEYFPEGITEDERKIALTSINKTNRKALYIAELKFNELIGKGFKNSDAVKISTKSASKYSIKGNRAALKIISKWSKERNFRTCIAKAQEMLKDTLNFLYNCDSRGRIYCCNSAILQPQGSDISKALLMFKHGKSVSTQDLAITIANLSGNDKLSYEDRIQWVNDNHNYILECGVNPWGKIAMDWLKETKIINEKKSKFQFIAACIEWVRLVDHLESGGFEHEFLCRIPVAYDATNSGLQILSIIGRDDYIAPYVNICATEKPGDVYLLIGNAVAKSKRIPSLDNVLEECSKLWRNIVKRNVMTKSYAATRYGMGTQQWDDKIEESDNNSAEQEAWANLTFEECVELGGVTYDTCSEYLKKGHELMQTCQLAVSHNENALVSWRMPNGFTAFQYKPQLREDKVVITVGSDDISFKIYKALDVGNGQEHSAAIAPDVTHSLDAYLLTMIVNALPKDANIAFVHDAFGSDSCYGGLVQAAARDAYYEISDRDVYAAMLKQIANGIDIELPEPGTYNPKEIFKADYIVC